MAKWFWNELWMVCTMGGCSSAAQKRTSILLSGLHPAVLKENRRQVKLLSAVGTRPNVIGSGGDTALFEAATSGKSQACADATDQRGETGRPNKKSIFLCAIRSGNTKLVVVPQTQRPLAKEEEATIATMIEAGEFYNLPMNSISTGQTAFDLMG